MSFVVVCGASMLWRLYPLAIALGLVTASGVAALVFAFELAIVGRSSNDFVTEQTGFHVATLAGSIACSFSAGWITARFAFGEELINSLATGVLLVVLTISGYFEPPVHDLPDWVDVSSLGLALPVCVMAGLLYRGRMPAA